jgi:hypothetical protein
MREGLRFVRRTRHVASLIPLFLSLAVVSSLAQPQPSTPRPSETAQKQQTQAEPRDHPLQAQAPSAPQQPTAAQARQQPQPNTNAQQNQPVRDWITWMSGLSNVVIAAFTIVLGLVAIWQGRVMRRTFVASNRPKIIVREIDMPAAAKLAELGRGAQQRSSDDIVTLTGSFRITNKGTTTATVGLRHATMYIGKRLPMTNPCFEKEKELPGPTLIMRPGTTERIPFLPQPITTDEIAGLLSGDLTLYVIGKIIYTDDLGNARRTGFARTFDMKIGRFMRPSGEQDYDYED